MNLQELIQKIDRLVLLLDRRDWQHQNEITALRAQVDGLLDAVNALEMRLAMVE